MGDSSTVSSFQTLREGGPSLGVKTIVPLCLAGRDLLQAQGVAGRTSFLSQVSPVGPGAAGVRRLGLNEEMEDSLTTSRI